jgi:hypothetical protein
MAGMLNAYPGDSDWLTCARRTLLSLNIINMGLHGVSPENNVHASEQRGDSESLQEIKKAVFKQPL